MDTSSAETGSSQISRSGFRASALAMPIRWQLPVESLRIDDGEMLNDPKFHIFYHAPVLVVIAAAEPTDWAVEDCALAAENLMLAAYAKGLGTCWIGWLGWGSISTGSHRN